MNSTHMRKQVLRQIAGEIIHHCNVKQLHLAQSVHISKKSFGSVRPQCDLFGSETTIIAAKEVQKVKTTQNMVALFFYLPVPSQPHPGKRLGL